MQSPTIFGDFVHGDQSAHHIGGVQPTTLTAEFWATFSVASNSETATGIGFCDAGGAVNVAGDAVAIIHSDGTNFICRSASDADTGALIDTDLHHWRIVISEGVTDAIEWFIDDVSQGTLNLRIDVAPYAWGCGILASTGANDIQMASAELSYR